MIFKDTVLQTKSSNGNNLKDTYLCFMEQELSEIVIYPVKGLKGISVSSAKCLTRGLAHDRRYLIVDDKGNFLSQREIPQMALIGTRIDFDILQLSHHEKEMSVLIGEHTNRTIPIKIWSHAFNAYLVDLKIDEWVSSILGLSCHLVFMDEDIVRNKSFIEPQGKIELSFADGYPYLVLGTASIDLLNFKLEHPIQADRFRANLVVQTNKPHIEDEWEDIMIGKAKFRIIKPCARCKVVTIDQQTANQGVEPLTTLNTYRKFGRKINFGANAICLTPGQSIKIGDKIEICKK